MEKATTFTVMPTHHSPNSPLVKAHIQKILLHLPVTIETASLKIYLRSPRAQLGNHGKVMVKGEKNYGSVGCVSLNILQFFPLHT